MFYPVFKPAFEKSVLTIAFVELSTNLLPIGAWIYTGKFDLELISFIFGIKRFFVFALLPIGISILVILSKSVTKYKSKTNDDTLRIRWIKEFIFLLSVLMLIIILPEVAYYFKFRSYTLFVVQGFVGAAIIAFIGLRNLNIQVVSAIETARETNSYNPEISLSFNQIIQLFDNEKIYCNSELRISDVAERISLSPNYVSKIINEKTKAGFNDFVNQYRVNHVIDLLKKKEYVKKNIFALAQEAGFNSKSTFQTGFKKFTGKTPSQFIKELEV